MLEQQVTWTLLGSGGGLAKAVLSILNQAAKDDGDPLQATLQTAELHLIDVNQKQPEHYENLYPYLYERIHLYRMDLRDLDKFRSHLQDTGTQLVIDVSCADTLGVLGCCDERGILYINSALENTAADEDPGTSARFSLSERYERFKEKRVDFTNTKAVVCTGMNPGIVQWMVLKLLQENPAQLPLACYIVEHDTSFYADMSDVRPQTIYASWSVKCFLDEAVLSSPMYMRNRAPMYLDEEVYSAEYRVRLGDKQFYGCLMPHEEVLTLGSMSDWEVGFLYRVNEHTTGQIRERLRDPQELLEWDRQVIEPAWGEVEGEDLVGVLLVYENEEKYMYNVMNSREVYPVYQTNATYFQVACGIYAAVASVLLDPVARGVHYVDELVLSGNSRYEDYLTRYMSRFVTGTNPQSDGLLGHRRRTV